MKPNIIYTKSCQIELNKKTSKLIIQDEIAACTEEELDWKAANRREAFV